MVLLLTLEATDDGMIDVSLRNRLGEPVTAVTMRRMLIHLDGEISVLDLFRYTVDYVSNDRVIFAPI